MSSVYSSYIKRMRMCANGNCEGCTYQYEGLTNTEECKEDLLHDAADMLEDADKCNARLLKKCKKMEKRIAEFEAQMPKDGYWIPNSPFTGICSECGGNGNLKDKYCPDCGAKTKTVTDCHTLEEGERC